MTRSYESNGPDVKVRGTAQHIAEKYLQLARDAQSSGDPVMAESYLQHAEHYFRLIAAAMQAQQQQLGFARPGGEAPETDDSDEDDDGDVPDRFASPFERNQPTLNPTQPNFASQPQPYPERQPQHERGPRPDHRQERQERQGQPRDFRDQRGPRDRNFGANQRPAPMLNEPQPADDAQPVPGLPAFITGAAPRPAPVEAPQPAQPENAQRFEAEHEAASFHLRNRRRRRPRGPGQDGAENGEAAGERPAADEVPAGE